MLTLTGNSDAEIAQKYENVSKGPESKLGDELTVDATRDTERLTRAINNILANPKNWIVSEIIKVNYDVVKVELKPLDISTYCKSIFEIYHEDLDPHTPSLKNCFLFVHRCKML